MNNIQEKYKGIRVEYHILQSFPVTCLNRDDVGAPKTAIVGGTTRARVSSQSWKRQVRMCLPEFGITLGIRSKHIQEKIKEYCSALGASEEQAKDCGEKIASFLSENTLHFFTETEAKKLAEYTKSKDFSLDTPSDTKKKEMKKEIEKIHKNAYNPHIEGLDIALFGRMAATAPSLNVEAAISFAHAISTHKTENDIDFFTALDDLSDIEENTGSSHLGILEFNSATYYRYINMDVGQLMHTLAGTADTDDNSDAVLHTAIEAFTKALYKAIPIARQTTQTGLNPWDYARVIVRKGQGLQASFDNPVRAGKEGYVQASVEALNTYIDTHDKMAGSMSGKVKSFEWGKNENYTLDNLIEDIQSTVRG